MTTVRFDGKHAHSCKPSLPMPKYREDVAPKYSDAVR